MVRFDIAIIGTGPAGISAAITAKVRNKNVLLLGSSKISNKVEKGHLIQNYPGLPQIAGPDLAEALLEHLEKMDIEITEAKVTAVYNMGQYYALQTDQLMYEATAVILATGVAPAKLFPGEEQWLGRGVSYCATCDAQLYKGKEVAVLGYSQAEEAEAEFLTEIVEKVYYFPMYQGDIRLPEQVEIVRELPESIEGKDTKKVLHTSGGVHEVDCIFILRDSVSPGQLVPGLTTEENRVVVDRAMKTSLAGCFACGDITGAPYQYIKSAGEGNVAALSAVAYIDTIKRNQNN